MDNLYKYLIERNRKSSSFVVSVFVFLVAHGHGQMCVCLRCIFVCNQEMCCLVGIVLFVGHGARWNRGMYVGLRR